MCEFTRDFFDSASYLFGLVHECVFLSTTAGKIDSQSETEVPGSVPGRNAFQTFFAPHRGGVCALVAPVYFISWQTASQGDGRGGNQVVFNISGGAGTGGGFHSKPGLECAGVHVSGSGGAGAGGV